MLDKAALKRAVIGVSWRWVALGFCAKNLGLFGLIWLDLGSDFSGNPIKTGKVWL
jgi:hypothetical protein